MYRSDSARPINTIALKSYYMNGGFADAFANMLKSNVNLSCLVLRNTRLSDDNFIKLGLNLPYHLKKLDISKNPELTMKSYQNVFKHLLDYRIKLTHMSFDGNEIGDEVCKELCTFVTKMGTLAVLNVSKCSISDVGAGYIAKLLESK